MSALSNYDLRQMLLIENTISMFENHSLSLSDLVHKLNGISNALESVDNDWKDHFRIENNILEIITDSIEDGSISRWEGDYKISLLKTIEKLKNLASSILEKYLTVSDSNILETAIVEDPNWFICPKCHDAWESNSLKAMIICPNCESALHNPHKSRIQLRLEE